MLSIGTEVGPETRPGCRGQAGRAAQTAAWLRDRAAPGDTGAVVFGGADVLLDTGVAPAYPYLWSLPVRTLDPDLVRLRRALRAGSAATWVVRTLPVDTWELDEDARVRLVLARDYRLVATVCGNDVLRRTAPLPG